MADIDLEAGRPRMAAHAGQGHAVGPGQADLRGADVGHHVGCQVGGRVVDLVQQLLLDAGQADHAAGARRLADDAVALAVDFGDGVAHVVEAPARPCSPGRRNSRRRPGRRTRAGGPPWSRAPAGPSRRRASRNATSPAPRSGMDRPRARPPRSARRRPARRRWLRRLCRRWRSLCGCRPWRRPAARAAAAHAARPTGRRRTPRQCAAPASSMPAAMAWMWRAAASGLAAPKLLTMRMLCARQRASTGRSMSSSSGSKPAVRVGPAPQLRQRQRAFGQGFKNQESRPAARDERVHHRPGGVHAVAGKAGGAADQERGAVEGVRHGRAVEALNLGPGHLFVKSKLLIH